MSNREKDDKTSTQEDVKVLQEKGLKMVNQRKMAKMSNLSKRQNAQLTKIGQIVPLGHMGIFYLWQSSYWHIQRVKSTERNLAHLLALKQRKKPERESE